MMEARGTRARFLMADMIVCVVARARERFGDGVVKRDQCLSMAIDLSVELAKHD